MDRRITGRPIGEVGATFGKRVRGTGSAVRDALAESNVTPHEWSPELLDFYSRTDAFLYELAIWITVY